MVTSALCNFKNKHHKPIFINAYFDNYQNKDGKNQIIINNVL